MLKEILVVARTESIDVGNHEFVLTISDGNLNVEEINIEVRKPCS